MLAVLNIFPEEIWVQMMYILIKNLLKLSNHFTQKGFVAKLFEQDLMNFA